ncbi:MAG: glucosyltransferase domain-containing protein [Bacilli bacterium]
MYKLKELLKFNCIKYNGDFLNDYFKNVRKLFFNNIFMLITLFFTFLTYGFSLYFHATGVDDLDTIRFFDNYGLISQGRFVGQILHEVFDVMQYHVFFTMAITIIIFIIASVLTAALLKMISGIKNYVVLAIFTGLLLTFPTNALIFKYLLVTVLTALGYLLSILAVVYTIQYCLTQKIKYLIVITLLLILLISSYESFVFVYFMMILFICLFSSTRNSKINVTSLLQLLIISMIVIIVATIFESLIANGLINILNVDKLDRVSISESVWLSSDSIIHTLKSLIINIFVDHYFVALFSFSHMFHVIVTILMFVGIFTIKDRKTRWINFFILIMINLTIFGISIVDGKSQLPRTLQTMATFVMFGSAYVYLMLDRKIFKKGFIIISAFAVYSGAHLQNMFYERDWQKNVEQERFFYTIIHDVESKYGTEQKIYFVGKYKIDDSENDDAIIQIEKNTLRGKIFNTIENRFYGGILENEGKDYYDFSYYSNIVYLDTFGTTGYPNLKQEYLIKYINYLGYDVNACNIKSLTVVEEEKISEDMTYYPQKGYIKKVDNCIFINIGPNDVFVK